MVNLQLRHKGLLIVGLPVLLTAVLTFILLQLLIDAETQLKRETFAAQLISVASRLQAQYFEASASVYTYHMTRSEFQMDRYDKAEQKIQALEKTLVKLLSGTDKEKKMARVIKRRGELTMNILREVRSGAPLHLGGTVDTRMLHIKLLNDPDKLTRELGEVISYGKLIEKNAPKQNAEIRAHIFYFAITLIFLNLLLAAFLAVYFTRSITGRLNVISDNALRLAADKELAPPVEGSDEIKVLDNEFREMVTQLEESRRKEKALVDNAVNVLASIDEECKFVNVSLAAMSAWGYNADELIGSRIANLLQEEDQALFLDKLSTLMHSNKEETFDTTLCKADGSFIETRWDVHWSNQEKALFCVITDVTQEKQLQELKQRLMDTVAHDLRTPISSIRATLSLISMGVLGDVPEKVIKRATQAESQSDRLIRLINDLLDFERLETGSVNLTLKPISVSFIVDESVAAVSDAAQKNGIKVNVESSDNEFLVDADRLIQVLVNLLGNAIKYSEKGQSITLEATASNVSTEFKVIDRGPGIPENQIQQIFDRFKMVEGSSAHKKAGSGLGLSIAKEIVELHGGRIGVKNNPEQGCTFWFTIPNKTAIDSEASKSQT